MSQAIVDPAELRRFALNLKRFNEELHSNLASLHGQSLNLAETWRDQEHARFTQEFEETLKSLHQFVEISNEHISLLVHKADRIEEYLQQR
jgi:uncharacterized protein YukE